MENDVRWRQRYSNFRKVLYRLESAVGEYNDNDLSELEEEGLIQRFEYTYELAWKTLKDILQMEGFTDIGGPNSVLKLAFKEGFISDPELWRNLKEGRDEASHTYDESRADSLVERIVEDYCDALMALDSEISRRYGISQNS